MTLPPTDGETDKPFRARPSCVDSDSKVDISMAVWWLYAMLVTL